MSKNVNSKTHKTLNERFSEVEVENRPMEIKTNGQFCLSVIDLLPIWYKKIPVGKTTIDTIMKKMKENSQNVKIGLTLPRKLFFH